MIIKILKFLSLTLKSISCKIEDWREAIHWKILGKTTVGPNPHEVSTIEWFLYEEGKRLLAARQLKAKGNKNPWMQK